MTHLKVNTQVEARRPGKSIWRVAKVLQEAVKGVHPTVKLKFLGEPTVFSLQWNRIKIPSVVQMDNALTQGKEISIPTKVEVADVVDLTAEDIRGNTTKPIESNSTFDDVGIQPDPNPKEKKRVSTPTSRIDWLTAKPVGPINVQSPAPLNVKRHNQDTSAMIQKPVALSRPFPLPKSRGNVSILESYITSTPSQRKPSILTKSKLPQQGKDQPNPKVRTPSKEHVLNSSQKSQPGRFQYRAIPTTNTSHTAQQDDMQPASRLFPEDDFDEMVPTTRIPPGEVMSDNSETYSPIFKGVSRGPLLPDSPTDHSRGLRVDRHPKEDIDKEFRIPRMRRPNSSDGKHSYEDKKGERSNGTDIRKRPRSFHESYEDDQLPPSINFYGKPSHVSRRRYKRGKPKHSKKSQDITEHKHLASLPTVDLVSAKSSSIHPEPVIVAGSFHSTRRFLFHSKEDDKPEEDAIFQEACATLSKDIELFSGTNQHFVKQGAATSSSVLCRSGQSRKGTPKRWCRRKRMEALTFVESFEAAVPFTMPPVIDERRDIPDTVLVGDNFSNGPSVPRIFDCMCGFINEPGQKSSTTTQGAIQCGVCGLWSHLKCTQLDADEVGSIRGEKSGPKKRFVCVQCLDFSIKPSHVQSLDQSTTRGSQESWQSQIKPLVRMFSGLRVDEEFEAMNNQASKEPRTTRKGYVRPPLTDADITARANNVEALRAGLPRASIGHKERTLIDYRIQGVQYANPESLNEQQGIPCIEYYPCSYMTKFP